MPHDDRDGKVSREQHDGRRRDDDARPDEDAQDPPARPGNPFDALKREWQPYRPHDQRTCGEKEITAR